MIIKINIFRGDLNDISAKTATRVVIIDGYDDSGIFASIGFRPFHHLNFSNDWHPVMVLIWNSMVFGQALQRADADSTVVQR